MKKLLLAGILAITLLMTTPTRANTAETATVTPHKLPSSMIDGIDVPYEVLEYAQMKYQGHAVTKVERTYRGSEQVYRLRVDRDDIPDDYNSIILLYTLKWKLIGEEMMVAPPKPQFVPPTRDDSTENTTKPESHQTQEQTENGRGGGGNHAEEESPEPEPEEPTEPDWSDEDTGPPLDSPPRGRQFR